VIISKFNSDFHFHVRECVLGSVGVGITFILNHHWIKNSIVIISKFNSDFHCHVRECGSGNNIYLKYNFGMSVHTFFAI
jgi:hypothetical protein